MLFGIPLSPASLCAAWAAGMAFVAALLWWLTQTPGPAALVLCAGLAGGAGLAAAAMVRLRHALDEAGQRQSALELALDRAQGQAAMGRLAAGLAHDFNNSLTVIGSNLELTAGALDPAQDRLLRHIGAAMHGVSQAAGLTNRMLGLSRQTPAEAEAVDVNRLLGRLADVLQRGLGERVRLDLLPAAQPWLVWADGNGIEAALACLVSHAASTIVSGEALTLSVDAWHAEPAAAGRQAASFVQIMVAPPGLAEPCWLDRPDIAGELASVARFAARLGGRLQASGAAWRLLLPRYAPPRLAAMACPAPQPGRPTILIVEDDAAVRGACAALLREHGHAVLEAPDAMEAFRLIADQGGIDLLVIDIGLPNGVTGPMLVEAARHADPDVRVLFITGHAAAAPSSAPLLRKPFKSAQLVNAVRDALREDDNQQPAVQAMLS